MRHFLPKHPNMLATIAGALLGLAIVLNLRRYAGITHDSMLYFGQALMTQWPGIFGKDIFFLYGSQADFSLFPWLTGLLFNQLPPPLVFLWGTLASLLLFAAACWFCLRAMLPEGQRYWAWIASLCLPSRYAITELFSYSEQFFTSRPIAEALCLFGIGFLIRKRWISAAGCLALAGSFHPLQTIAALLVLWPWLLLQNKRWLHLAWLSLPIVLLALLGIAPFKGLLQQIDPGWLVNIEGNTRQMFLSLWSAQDFYSLAFDVFILGYATRALQGGLGRWCLASIFGLGLGLLANLILVDGLHLVLPAGLQLWRVHWMAHWFAMVALGLLLLRDARAHDWPRVMLLLLVAQLAWTMPVTTWAPLAILYAFWAKLFATGRHPQLPRILGMLFGLGSTLLLANYIATDWVWFRLAHYRLDIYAFDRRLLAFPAVALGLPALGIFIWNRATNVTRFLLILTILLPLTVLGTYRWDSRPWINRAFEQATFHTNIFGTPIPKHAQVYWDPETFLAPWMVLKRASFYSGGQLGGGGFERRTSIAGNRRAARMITLMDDSNHCQDRDHSLAERETCRVSDLGMQRACSPDGNDAPDYLVLRYLQPQRNLGTWKLIDPVTNDVAAQYWLYSCKMVMEDMKIHH